MGKCEGIKLMLHSTEPFSPVDTLACTAGEELGIKRPIPELMPQHSDISSGIGQLDTSLLGYFIKKVSNQRALPNFQHSSE